MSSCSRYEENGENARIYVILYNTRQREVQFVLLTTLSTRDKKQLTRRCTLDLDVQSNHGQPDSCRARPVKVDDGLEDVMWIRDLGGEGLHALSLLHPHKKTPF